jgi:hypothetical protein
MDTIKSNATIRAYILKKDFDSNSNGIYEFDNFNIKDRGDKKIRTRKYMVKKRAYLNINQKTIDDTVITYCEHFSVLHNNHNKIIIEMNTDILENEEFPPLSKYDFDEEYEEIELITKYGKIIENKYESYLEIDPKYCNKKYYDLIFI